MTHLNMSQAILPGFIEIPPGINPVCIPRQRKEVYYGGLPLITVSNLRSVRAQRGVLRLKLDLEW
jgi:hypothetical protein